MATNAVTADYRTSGAVRERRWHPGARITVAILLAVVSWTPILVAGMLLGR